MPEVEGFILELYRNGSDQPYYISGFEPTTEIGFSDYSEDKSQSVIFQSREALLPLASIEVEAIMEDGDDEFSVYDGFRILPAKANVNSQYVTDVELESALASFES